MPAAVEADVGGVNPILSPNFCRTLKRYLNGLPNQVRQQSAKSTHAIKTFLMREGRSDGVIGYANGIKLNLHYVRNVEFLWDAAAKVPSSKYPGEDCDLTFVAESENQPHIEKIIEDANKLPIVRADARLMFFRAINAQKREEVFERLYGLFARHRKTQTGDIYIMAGMDMQTSAYAVRKLTIPRPGSNESPWQEF